MADLEVRVEGLQQLERNWLRLAEDLGPRRARTVANRPLREAIAPVTRAITSGTPVDQGGLQESIDTQVRIASRNELRQGTFTRDDVAVVRTGWFWRSRSLWFQALAVEYGTRFQSAQNVLRSALESRIRIVTNLLASRLGRNIERRAARLARTGR